MKEDRVYLKTNEIIDDSSVKVEKIGEITSTYKGNNPFKNGVATHLESGVEVFKSLEENTTDYLFIKSEDHYIKYVAETEE